MSYYVTDEPEDLQLNLTDTVASVLQNVKCIMQTLKGDVPLHREIGLAGRFIDKPINIAPTLMVADLKEAIEEGEPRVEFIGATFEVDPSDPARLKPTVEVNIIES